MGFKENKGKGHKAPIARFYLNVVGFKDGKADVNAGGTAGFILTLWDLKNDIYTFKADAINVLS